MGLKIILTRSQLRYHLKKNREKKRAKLVFQILSLKNHLIRSLWKCFKSSQTSSRQPTKVFSSHRRSKVAKLATKQPNRLYRSPFSFSSIAYNELQRGNLLCCKVQMMRKRQQNRNQHTSCDVQTKKAQITFYGLPFSFDAFCFFHLGTIAYFRTCSGTFKQKERRIEEQNSNVTFYC